MSNLADEPVGVCKGDHRKWSWKVLSTRYENVWAEARFELVHEACCYAGQLGVVIVCPSLAANGRRLGGVVGKRAEAQSGVSRARPKLGGCRRSLWRRRQGVW